MSPHLSETELSDLVDGGSSAHVDTCAECAARLGAWRSAHARLAEPVAVPAGEREAAVAAALAEPGGRLRPAGWAAAALAQPGGRLRPARWAAVAAAAVIVIAAAVGVEVASGSRHPRPQREAAALPAFAADNLGSLAGPAQVAAAVNAHLSQSAGVFSGESPVAKSGLYPQNGTSGGSGFAGGSTAGVGSSGASASSGAGASSAGAPGPTASVTTASPAGAPGPTASATTAPPATAPPGACRLPAGTRGTVLLVAVADYRSVPAQVVVVESGGTEKAVVQSDSGCRLLAVVDVADGSSSAPGSG